MLLRAIKRAVFILTAALALVLPINASADSLELEVSSSRDSLYLEESLILTVKVSGADRDANPDLSAIEDCEITSLGSRSQSYSSISWVNGKRTQTGFSGRIFSYNITPMRTGKITLGPISVAAGSKKAKASGPTVTVTGIEEQDDVIIKLTASRNEVLVDESFEINLNILIKCLPPPHRDTERLLATRPPHLSVPYLILSPMDGLEHTDIRMLLQNMITRRESQSSFTLNNYASRKDPFDFDSMFNFNDARRSTPDRFSLPVEKTTINGQAYWSYRVQTQYIAKEERTHTFGPILFKGGIIENIGANNQVALKDIFAVGASQTVRVVPPPEEGRPQSFIGAIGTNMVVDASLDAQNCQVGDPLTLTLSVSGDINLKNIYPPDLAKQPQILKQFRLYEDTLSIQKDPDQVSFSYTVRPTEAGTLEIPPLSLSYFDSASRIYRTMETAPIPVTASAAGGIDTDMILGADTNLLNDTGADGRSSLQYVAPFTTSETAAENTRFGLSIAQSVLLILAPGIFLASLAIRPVKSMKRGMDVKARTKATFRQTIKSIREAKNLPPDEASSALSEALLSYSQAYFNIRASSLTPPELSQFLRRAGLPEDLRSDLRRIVECHYNAAFTHESIDETLLATDIERAIEIVEAMEAFKRKDAHTSPLMLAFISLFSLAAFAFANTETEADFLWQKAWSRTVSASSPEDFERAAYDYRELVAEGTRNKHIFHNLGTALLLSGNDEEALTALQRAERYGGTDKRLLHNIQLARSGENIPNTSLSWQRAVFFWHFALPHNLRVNIAIGGWVALFLILSAGRRLLRDSFRPLLIVAAAVLVIFGTSALTSALEEHKERIRDTYIWQQADIQEEAQ